MFFFQLSEKLPPLPFPSVLFLSVLMSDLADSVGNWTINWFAYLCAILEPEVHYYEVKYWQKP